MERGSAWCPYVTPIAVYGGIFFLPTKLRCRAFRSRARNDKADEPDRERLPLVDDGRLLRLQTHTVSDWRQRKLFLLSPFGSSLARGAPMAPAGVRMYGLLKVCVRGGVWPR